jgi:hypothetical protein
MKVLDHTIRASMGLIAAVGLFIFLVMLVSAEQLWWGRAPENDGAVSVERVTSQKTMPSGTSTEVSTIGPLLQQPIDEAVKPQKLEPIEELKKTTPAAQSLQRSRAVEKNMFEKLLGASKLSDAPFGMLVVYFMLILALSVGVYGALDKKERVTRYCAHALPFLGVMGTLLAFAILTSANEDASGLKDAFATTLSYAAFTTTYGLLGSLILEIWLHSWDAR